MIEIPQKELDLINKSDLDEPLKEIMTNCLQKVCKGLFYHPKYLNHISEEDIFN